MRKYLLIGIFLVACKCHGWCQQYEELKIDTLKTLLHSLHDTLRIDCLNDLSYYYTVMSNQDSAAYFSELAEAEAKKLNYTHGIAEALSRKAGILEHFENNFQKEKEIAGESLQWYNKTANKRKVGILYDQLAFALFAESSYDEALSYLQKEYEYYKKIGDEHAMRATIDFMAAMNVEKGDYDKGFDLAQQDLQMALRQKDEVAVKEALNGIGTLCLRIGDYPAALYYYRTVLQNLTRADSIVESKGEYNTWSQMEFAEIYTHLHQYDSALYRYNLFDSLHAQEKDLRIFLVSKGEYYLARKQYKNALHNFLQGLYYHRKLHDTNEIMRTLLDIGTTYAALENNDLALTYARQGLSLALQTKARQFIRDGYEILYSVYNTLQNADSALLYYQQYITAKDIVADEQVKGKFAAYNYENKIELLNKEKQIQQTKLQSEGVLKKILYAGILTLLLLGFIIFRNILLKRRNEAHRREIAENELQLQKLESEKRQEELQHKAKELEMQALRAQMNPHFIFNCLSSINRFILKNESEPASDYLTKFSRLIRMVLNNSKRELISLDDELEMLQLYLEMERMRFKYSFDYKISFKNETDFENVFIPPLLLQPFAENAIWHGLMNKEGPGHLTVLLSKEDSKLTCIIEDNGVGRAKAAELKSKSAERKKSLGLQITKERLSLLNGDSIETTFFEVEDLFDDKGNALGTRVILKIRLANGFEEPTSIS